MRIAILGSNPCLPLTWTGGEEQRSTFRKIICVNYALTHERNAEILCAGDLIAYIRLGNMGIYPKESYHTMDHEHPESHDATSGMLWGRLRRTVWQDIPELFTAIPRGDGQINPRNWSIQAAIDMALWLGATYIELHGVRWSCPTASLIYDVSGLDDRNSRTNVRWLAEHRDLDMTCKIVSRRGVELTVASMMDSGSMRILPWQNAADRSAFHLASQST